MDFATGGVAVIALWADDVECAGYGLATGAALDELGALFCGGEATADPGKAFDGMPALAGLLTFSLALELTVVADVVVVPGCGFACTLDAGAALLDSTSELVLVGGAAF